MPHPTWKGLNSWHWEQKRDTEALIVGGENCQINNKEIDEWLKTKGTHIKLNATETPQKRSIKTTKIIKYILN